jgi:hypothetical protein
MYKISVLTGEDLAGQAREETMQEGLEAVHTRLTVHEFKTQNIYDRMATDVYGMGALRNKLHNHELFPSRTLLKNETPTASEFRHAADLFAQARGEGDELGMKAAMDLLGDKVPADKKARFEEAIKEMADHDDVWFNKFGQAEVELGFIKAEDFIPGYRPQNWNAELVKSNMDTFTGQIEELIGGEPDADFIVDALATIGRQRADDAGEGAEVAPIAQLNEGEEWPEFAKRMSEEDPNLVRDILEDWDEVRAARVSEALAKNEKDLKRELENFGNRQVEEVLAEGDDRINKMVKRHFRKNQELQELQAKVNQPSTRATSRESFAITRQLDEKATDLARLERNIETEKNMLIGLRRMQEYRDHLRNQIGVDARKASNDMRVRRDFSDQRQLIADLQQQMREMAAAGRRTTPEMRALKKRLSKLQRTDLKKRGQKRLKETAREIALAISKNRNPGGFHVDDALENTRFFKHRSLNLKGVRHEDKWRRFMNTDPGMNMEIYVQATARQLEMRRKYLPFLRKEGLVGEDGQVNIEQGLTDYLQQGLENDIRTIRETMSGEAAEAEIKRLQKDFADNLTFMQKAFGEFTRSDYLKHANESYDRVISTAQSATTAMALGMALLSSIADVAVSALAGTRVGTGIVDMLRPAHNSGILKAIAKDNELLAMYMRGSRVMDNGMIVSRMDTDAPSLDVPGGMLAKIQRMTNSAAQLEMWTNLLHGWNRWVRGSFGVGFMRQISKDLAGYDGLRPDLKGFYAKHGIGEADAKQMAVLYEKHSKDVSGVLVPDLDAWAAEGHSDLVDKFYRTVNGAGNEALLDPGLGDRPFLRANPLGRLILQFQSFTYSAGERWFAPLIQLGMMRPTDARVMWSSTMAIGLAGMGQTLRDYAQGRESKLSIAMETGETEDIWRVLTEAYLRSPYVTGMQGTAIDVIGTQLADPVNSAFQAITGTEGEPINPEYVRFKQGQGIFALAGPAAGTTNTMLKAGRNLLEGDLESVYATGQARTPVANTFPVVLLRRLVEELPGD